MRGSPARTVAGDGCCACLHYPPRAECWQTSAHWEAAGSVYHVNASSLPGNDVSRAFEGGKHGPSSVSFFLVPTRPGEGSKLHHHRYDETFVIPGGHVLVRVGEESIEGGPGDIVIGPAGIPHGFTSLG